MWRYIASAAVAGLLLAIALKSKGLDVANPGDENAPVVAKEQPRVSVEAVPGGKNLTVRHRFAGSVSRATLVYNYQGVDCTAAKRTDCQQVLEGSSNLQDDGYTTQVELSGRIPLGASSVRLVLEDETGTTVVPVEVN